MAPFIVNTDIKTLAAVERLHPQNPYFCAMTTEQIKGMRDRLGVLRRFL